MDDWERERQAKRDREPLRYCRWITDRPKLFFGLTLGGHLFFMVLTGVLIAAGYDLIPIVFDALPLDIRDDEDFLRGLAWDFRTDTAKGLVGETEESEMYQPERTEMFEIVEFVYHYKDGENIFTAENLKAIKTVEDEFYDNDEFQKNFCLKGFTGNCVKPNSVLRYFDGSKAFISPIFNDQNFQNIDAVLHEASTNARTIQEFQYFIGKNNKTDGSESFTDAMRSSLTIGGPLKGYNNTDDRNDDQLDDLKKFIFDHFKKIGDKHYNRGINGMEFLYNSITITSVTITTQVFKDFSLIIFSFLFIVVFMCIQTGSIWVSLFAILSIFTGFCGANLVYRVILDFRYFGIFHILAVFIILGIGADDIFVFFDTWKETSHFTYKSLAHRMSHCYRRAALAMMYTSLTTSIAFFVSATSPFLAVYSFGVFAGLLVLVNYCSVIIFFPTVVITYHLYWEKYKCCCCCPKPEVSAQESQAPPKKKKVPTATLR